jgi:hypothetical protein
MSELGAKNNLSDTSKQRGLLFPIFLSELKNSAFIVMNLIRVKQ